MATKTAPTKAPASNGAKRPHVEIGGVAYPVATPGAAVHTMIRPIGQTTSLDGTSVSVDEVDAHVTMWLKAGYKLLTAQVIGSQTATSFVTNVLYVLVKYE